MALNRLLSFIILVFITHVIHAQSDTIILTNNNMIDGEVKSMDRGILTIETDYSDSDFKIEWEKIKYIKTETSFFITLTDGRRFNGTIETSDSLDIHIVGVDFTENVDLDQIVYLKSIDSGFWSQVYASIDLGYSITRANNLQQFSLRSKFGYLAERWSADANYNNVFSSQDDVADVHRIDAGLSYRYYLPKDWFGLAQISWLSNTEQSLKLRTVSKLGVGKYLVHTNRTYWAIQAGGSFNNEAFSDGTPTRKSAEGFFGTELNMYDIGDLSLLTNVVVYPSITESGRWRVDYTLDTKYDLPLDFYINIGFTLNFDNQPVMDAGKTDYVFQTTFGWSL